MTTLSRRASCSCTQTPLCRGTASVSCSASAEPFPLRSHAAHASAHMWRSCMRGWALRVQTALTATCPQHGNGACAHARSSKGSAPQMQMRMHNEPPHEATAHGFALAGSGREAFAAPPQRWNDVGQSQPPDRAPHQTSHKANSVLLFNGRTTVCKAGDLGSNPSRTTALEEALLSEVAPVVRTDRLAVGLPHLPFAQSK
jgi:hypothetical protein